MTNEQLIARKQAADSFSAEFKTKTGVSIGKFFNVLFGFDVVAFDGWLGVPDGKSTAEVISERYGEEFTRKIKALI